MMKTFQVHVGESFNDIVERVIDACDRAERGHDVEEYHLSFENPNTFDRELPNRRIALLKHLQRRPRADLRDLVQALGRDASSVSEDIEVLKEMGLLEETGDRLEAAQLSMEEPAAASNRLLHGP